MEARSNRLTLATTFHIDFPNFSIDDSFYGFSNRTVLHEPILYVFKVDFIFEESCYDWNQECVRGERFAFLDPDREETRPVVGNPYVGRKLCYAALYLDGCIPGRLAKGGKRKEWGNMGEGREVQEPD